MDRKQKLLLFFIFIIFGIAFFLKGITSSDPDFFWHIKAGEVISTSGIPKTDPFSYTMPGYPFVNHEWLTDLITYKLYPVADKFGLSFVYATMALLSLILVTPKSGWAIIPLILSSTLLMSFAGIRPQIISWFFVAVILKIVMDQSLWQKWRLGLPLIFLIWANLHGGFVVGAGVVLLAILTRIWQVKRWLLSDLLVLVMSVLASLVNPYGGNLWKEIWNSLSDPSLRWSVAEWYPALARIDLVFLTLFTLSIFLVVKFRAYFGPGLFLPFIAFCLAGLFSVRNIPFWVLINIPVLSLCLEKFYRELKNYPVKLRRFIIVHKTLLVLTVLISVYHVTTSFKTDLEWPEEKLYPATAISFLKQHPPKGEVFAPYSWGGYLILNYSEKKVFVDGRMPSWRWDPPNADESSYAYKEYRDIIFHGGDFDKSFNKYGVRTVLWTSTPYLEPKLPESFTRRLEKAGWKKVFMDEVAVIYER